MHRKSSLITQIFLAIFEAMTIAAVIVVFLGWWVALP